MTENTSKPPSGENARSSFRTVPVKQRSIWESYAVLPARTRLKLSLAVTAVAAAGIFASNYLENALPVPSAAERGSVDEATKVAPPSP